MPAFTPVAVTQTWTWQVTAATNIRITTVGIPGPAGPTGPQGPAGTSDHAALSNLGYAASGHSGFAGTGVANTFSQTQRVGDAGDSIDLNGADRQIEFRDGGSVAAEVGWDPLNGYVYLENVGGGVRAFLRNDGYFESPVGFVTGGGVAANTLAGDGSSITNLNAAQLTGLVPTASLPALAISEFLGAVASEAAMLALSGQRGDWCHRTDQTKTYILITDDPTQAANWKEVLTPGGAVWGSITGTLADQTDLNTALSLLSASIAQKAPSIAPTLTGMVTVDTGGNATVGVRIRQNSGSQTARLFELTDSTGGTVLAGWSANGSNIHTPDGFSIGPAATANSNHGVAVGNQSVAGSQAAALGLLASAGGGNSVAIGALANASGGSAVSIGVLSAASQSNAIAIGNSATCNQQNSAVIGAGKNLAADEFVWGNQQGLGAVAHFRVTGHSSSTPRSLWHVTTAWVDSDDSNHQVAVRFRVNDYNNLTTGQEILVMQTNGTEPLIGFLGASAVPRQEIDTLLTGDDLTLAVVQALNNLGLTVSV